jgi:large subunit ribosomal protein L25
VVQLQGAASGDALVRDVQWDTFGGAVLHLDLTRVSAGETVEMTVPVELRGDAPGTHHGGVVQHLHHELEIRCPVRSLPERLEVNINHLELDGAITVADIKLPAGAEAVLPASDIVVQCVPAVEDADQGGVGSEGAEPELIKRKDAAAGEE